MEEGESQPQSTPAPPSTPPQTTGNSTLVVLLVILVLVIIGAVGWYLYTNGTFGGSSKSTKTTATLPKTATEAGIGDETVSGTPGIKNYTNSKPVYTFLYPDDWRIDSSKATDKGEGLGLELTFTKKSHMLRVYQPAGYGGALCTYEDSKVTPTTDGPGPASFGKFIEIKNPKYTFRRPVTPRKGEDNLNTWDVCQKDKDGNFVISTALDLITYIGPEDYDESILKEMDQMLKTLTVAAKATTTPTTK